MIKIMIKIDKNNDNINDNKMIELVIKIMIDPYKRLYSGWNLSNKTVDRSYSP